MAKKEVMIIADYSQSATLTTEELCDICGINLDDVKVLVAYEIIHPVGNAPHQWHFNLQELHRLQRALRLQRDLEVNLAGAALALDLLEQMEELRKEMQVLRRHYLS